MRSRIAHRLDRSLYAAYTVRSVATAGFRRNLSRASAESGLSRTRLGADMCRTWLRHDTLPNDYLYFEMWSLPDAERGRYVSTLQMYRYQRWANDRRARQVFRDKREFRHVFREYLLNVAVDLDSPADVSQWLDEHRPTHVAVKAPLDQAGRGVVIADVEQTPRGWEIDSLHWQVFVTRCRGEGLTLLEQGLTQHPSLARLNPSSVNTIRVITRLHPNGSVQIVSAILRVGVGGSMDNFAAGGVACPLDVHTGRATGPLRSKGIGGGTGSFVHPVTGATVEHFTVPHWDEVLTMVREVTTRVPQVRTVGWDVVIGPDRPGLVEGNDNWDKTHWQKTEGSAKGQLVSTWWEEETGGVSPWALSVGKRVMDVAIAGVAVIALAPMVAATALLVRSALGRPVLYVSERPGLFSVPFQIHKFRTMTNERDASGELLPATERLTKVGRRLRATSLDEIPELFDVLTGRMSLVGPRPLRLDYLGRYSAEQARRHLVKPGLTGLAQVGGRERLDWDSRFDLDVEYVATCSFAGDLRILWQTARRLLADAEPARGPLVSEFVGAAP